jgi:hypothetical protein
MILTKLKARISRFRPEKKITLLLQHDNTRPHTSSKTMEHIAKFDWTLLFITAENAYLVVVTIRNDNVL